MERREFEAKIKRQLENMAALHTIDKAITSQVELQSVLKVLLDDPEGLVEFDHPMGYRYEPGLTTETADGVTHVSLVARRA